VPIVHLQDRALVYVGGETATEFLQGLVTSDVEALLPGVVGPSALLTPQGKIMFDFLVSLAPEGGYRIDLRAAHADDFIRRLTLYRLRAKITITLMHAVAVHAIWGDGGANNALIDSRFPAGSSVLRLYGDGPLADADLDAWTELRIRHGIAESGADYALSDVFPHDVLMDKSGGIGFRKGCFVGQEVVSRMQHRGTARRRVVTVRAAEPLPASGADITAGGRTLGSLGSVLGAEGLAIVRTDRVAEALADGLPLTVGGVAVALALPDWSDLGFERRAGQQEA